MLIPLILHFIFLCRFPKSRSVPSVLTQRYGNESVIKFRLLEKTTYQLLKHQRDITFLIKCRDADLIPVFLQYKLANNRMRGSRDVRRARQRLLCNEIAWHRKFVLKLTEKQNQLLETLKSQWKRIDIVFIRQYIEKGSKSYVSVVDERHARKLSNLRIRQRSIRDRLDPATVITNLSDYELTDVEMRVLCKGLDFALPPRKLKYGEYLATFECLAREVKHIPIDESCSFDRDTFLSKLSSLALSSFYNYNSVLHRSNLNITIEEKRALLNLSKNEQIIVTKPDKGRGVVILNRSDYFQKVQSIFADTSKFKMVTNRDVYKQSQYVEDRLTRYLLDLKNGRYISMDLYNQLRPNGTHVGKAYGLPKTHKSGVNKDTITFRPIISAVGTSHYMLSKYLTKILEPVRSNDLSFCLRNTYQFLDEFKNIDITSSTMVSFDVVSLFTNIPLNKTIDICCRRLYHDPKYEDSLPNIPEEVFRNLLHRATTENAFMFNGQLYCQIDGVAMGSPLGPVLADIYMSELEGIMCEHPLFPKFYRRYVDDTFCIFNSIDEANLFLSYINSLDNSIKFTMETEIDGHLEFLDTIVSRPDGARPGFPIFNSRERETNKGLYFNYESCIPHSYKIGLIKCLFNTALCVCSTWKLFHAEVTRLSKVFRLNGYPEGIIHHCAKAVLDNFLSKHDDSTVIQGDNAPIPPSKTYYMTTIYLGPCSDTLKRNILKLMSQAFPKIDLRIVFKKKFCIKDLFRYKDALPLSCRSWVVYHSQCDSCSAAYIGKTINLLHQRFYKSPLGHLYTSNMNSELLRHMALNPNHMFNFKDIKILDTAPNNNNLLEIKETLYINHLKPSLTTKTSTPLVLF